MIYCRILPPRWVGMTTAKRVSRKKGKTASLKRVILYDFVRTSNKVIISFSFCLRLVSLHFKQPNSAVHHCSSRITLFLYFYSGGGRANNGEAPTPISSPYSLSLFFFPFHPARGTSISSFLVSRRSCSYAHTPYGLWRRLGDGTHAIEPHTRITREAIACTRSQ